LLEGNGLAIDLCSCNVLGAVIDVVAVVVLLEVGVVVVGTGVVADPPVVVLLEVGVVVVGTGEDAI
jgi:hypothetical protein